MIPERLRRFSVAGRNYRIHSFSGVVVDDGGALLQAPDGRIQAFKLRGFDIVARNAHTLTVLWAVAQGTDSGPNFAVYDHDARAHLVQDNALRRIASPGFLRTTITTTLGAVVLLPITGPLALLAAPIAALIGYTVLRHRNLHRIQENVCAPLFRHLAGQSARNDLIGSSRAARPAGTSIAARATPISTAAAARYAIG